MPLNIAECESFFCLMSDKITEIIKDDQDRMLLLHLKNCDGCNREFTKLRNYVRRFIFISSGQIKHFLNNSRKKLGLPVSGD